MLQCLSQLESSLRSSWELPFLVTLSILEGIRFFHVSIIRKIGGVSTYGLMILLMRAFCFRVNECNLKNTLV